jgi:hypothetical protein
MADTKISALPASTTPLAGTEVLPIVQGGATKQVSVANLTAGRAVSALSLALTAGNLTVADGFGIDFSATPGTGTSELFNDYEEGSWTPVFYTNTFDFYSLTSANGRYTKIGRIVHVEGQAVFAGGPPTGGFLIPNLPYAPASGNAVVGQFSLSDTGDSYFRDGPGGNWILQGGIVYALAYGNNSASLWNGISAGDSIGFNFTYSV